MKNILALLPNAIDATSFYRGLGPLVDLQKKLEFELNLVKEVNWATLKPVDLLFLQRPYKDNHVKILELAQDNGVPVWIDYDDDLFSVPRSNQTHKVYGNQKHQNNIAQMLSMANVVTVSTEALKFKFVEILQMVQKAEPNYEGLNLDPKKIIVVPNAYDEGFVKYRQFLKKQPHQNKLITWRGSNTHDQDLWEFTPALKNAFSKHLDWTLNFIGEAFWMTIEELGKIPNIKPTNIVETESVDPAQYWKMLYLTAPALIIVPLHDCPFNRAKSNIAWIEGLHAGAVTLAPNWPEWRRPGVINYDNQEDFEQKLDSFMRGEINGENLYQDGWKYLKENLTLKKVNLIRERIIKRFWGE